MSINLELLVVVRQLCHVQALVSGFDAVFEVQISRRVTGLDFKQAMQYDVIYKC